MRILHTTYPPLRRPDHRRLLTVANQKGGVGKTSTTFHLGGELARRGLRTLIVDADAQASLTQGVLGPEVTEGLDPSRTIAAIFDEPIPAED